MDLLNLGNWEFEDNDYEILFFYQTKDIGSFEKTSPGKDTGIFLFKITTKKSIPYQGRRFIHLWLTKTLIIDEQNLVRIAIDMMERQLEEDMAEGIIKE